MKYLVALCALAVSASAQVGPSGFVDPTGNNVQFSHAFADNIAVVGPSGIVTKDGRNLQLSFGPNGVSLPPHFATFRAAAAAPAPVAAPLPAGVYSHKDVFGPSGVVSVTGGGNTQFTAAQADNIVLVGPSGVVTKDGSNMQFVRRKRSIRDPIIGSSGIIAPDGQLLQLKPGVTVVAAGPSAILLSNGEAIQYNFNA